jgi:hypothetical protein
MSNIKKDQTELLWLRPFETDGSQYDDCVRRSANRLDVRTGDQADDGEALEWLVIEGLLRAWRAPRDS